jgi:hypothetical protein
MPLASMRHTSLRTQVDRAEFPPERAGIRSAAKAAGLTGVI